MITGSVGIVERKTIALDLPADGYRLETGAVIRRIDVAYEECGAPLAEDNAVFICHALTGDAHVAGVKPGETEPSGWWESMVGPGRAIDTNRFHVICANVFGGCSGTTGPGSVNPETGKPYGSSFPRHTLSDTVDVYRMLLRQLGVKKLAALIGASYGGIQAMDWITRRPDEMEKACLIATSASLNTQALAFDIVGRAAITDDPDWRGGDYYGEDGAGKGPAKGLAAARQLAHITYLSRELLQRKFQRKLQQNFVDAPPEERERRERDFKTYFQIESYLDHQAAKFIARFDADSYLHITRAMDLFDAGGRYGSLDAACARVKAKCLVVSYGNDILFAEWQSKDIIASLLRNGKDATYCHIKDGAGHDSFLTNTKDLSGVVGNFLSGERPRPRNWQRRLHRDTLAMVKPGLRVIDIGCGNGTLMNLLAADRNAACTGVEIDIGRFKEAVATGAAVLWEDADAGLATVPDGRYDVAVCSDTLQEVRNPRLILREALRIADEAIVAFPNFAEYRIRLKLGLCGRLPVSKALPFQWYDTPNIHCMTLKDFRALCDAEGIEIKELRAESRHLLGRILIALGMKNLGAARITARLGKKKAK